MIFTAVNETARPKETKSKTFVPFAIKYSD